MILPRPENTARGLCSPSGLMQTLPGFTESRILGIIVEVGPLMLYNIAGAGMCDPPTKKGGGGEGIECKTHLQFSADFLRINGSGTTYIIILTCRVPQI